jgi:hypothetical protein
LTVQGQFEGENLIVIGAEYVNVDGVVFFNLETAHEHSFALISSPLAAGLSPSGIDTAAWFLPSSLLNDPARLKVTQ